MEQSEFEKRFSEIQATLRGGNGSYRFKDVNDVWENIGSAPLDKFFAGLAELYLISNDSQRWVLCTYCGQQHVILENLWYFVRRVGRLIHSKEDKRWFEIGLASALMDGGRADYRDLIISLVLLRFIAERREIDIKPVFNTFIQSADGNMKGILENVRNHPESSIHMTVQDFGHPEWVAESVKIYGEYNMHTIAKATKEQLAKQNKAQEKKTLRKVMLDFFKRK